MQVLVRILEWTLSGKYQYECSYPVHMQRKESKLTIVVHRQLQGE